MKILLWWPELTGLQQQDMIDDLSTWYARFCKYTEEEYANHAHPNAYEQTFTFLHTAATHAIVDVVGDTSCKFGLVGYINTRPTDLELIQYVRNRINAFMEKYQLTEGDYRAFNYSVESLENVRSVHYEFFGDDERFKSLVSHLIPDSEYLGPLSIVN